MQWLALVYIVKSFTIQSNCLSSETGPSVSQALSPGFDAHPRELGLGTWLKQSKCLTMCDIGQCESIDPSAMLMVTWCHSDTHSTVALVCHAGKTTPKTNLTLCMCRRACSGSKASCCNKHQFRAKMTVSTTIREIYCCWTLVLIWPKKKKKYGTFATAHFCV